jgi:hypothetical protein
MGCGTEAGYVYWFSYTLLNTWIILNLFFALLLSSIDEISKLEDSAVSRFMLKDLMILWRNFDPDAHGFISYKDFWVFSSQVIVKFGLTGDELRNLNNKKNFLKFMQIPVYRDVENNYFGYRFHDTIITLCKTAVIIKYGAVEYDKFSSFFFFFLKLLLSKVWSRSKNTRSRMLWELKSA